MPGHLSGSAPKRFEILLVDQVHQFQVQGSLDEQAILCYEEVKFHNSKNHLDLQFCRLLPP